MPVRKNLLRCKRGSRPRRGRSPKVWMSGEQIWYLPAAVHVGVWIFKCTLFGWVSFSDVSLLHIGLCRVVAKIHGHSQDNIFTMSDCQNEYAIPGYLKLFNAKDFLISTVFLQTTIVSYWLLPKLNIWNINAINQIWLIIPYLKLKAMWNTIEDHSGLPLIRTPLSTALSLLSVWEITVDRGQIPVWNYKLIVK